MIDDRRHQPGARVVRLDLAGTVVFLVALAIAVPWPNHRFAQFLIGGVSMALFAIGVATTLWAYTRALDRSRAEEVGVANLYLLTGDTAPKRFGRTLTAALVDPDRRGDHRSVDRCRRARRGCSSMPSRSVCSCRCSASG